MPYPSTKDNNDTKRFLRISCFKFWTAWFIVTFATRTLTNLLGLPVARQVLIEGSSTIIISLLFKLALFGAVIGGVVGLGQSIVLSRWLPDARWWSLYTLAGWAIGLPLVISITQFGNIETTPLLFAGLIGGATGFSQWLYFRKELRYALWWIPVTMVSEGISRIAQLGIDPTGTEITSIMLGSVCVSIISASIITPLIFTINKSVVKYTLPDWYLLEKQSPKE